MAVELLANRSVSDVDVAIRACYRYVLGNPHVMESERLTTAESQLRNGDISVRDFVRAIGKSDFYRSRYFEKCAPYRFVELNFMHFLGRPPESQAEVAAHIRRCVEEGYEAEIDSFIDSDEYLANFGNDTVPFNRGSRTESGLKQLTYNRSFQVDRGPAQVSSSVKASQLVGAIPANSGNKIRSSTATVTGSGTERKFRIVVTGSAFDAPRRVSTTEYIVSARKMTPTIQRINRTSGKIVSITEVA
ncbi:MAG: photosystem I reaction center subunit XII [Alkalinema sp. RL_2_19]|nr:photosystem I reaction center subunit XII [Alkalinema sp. RL_2_19]